MDSKSAEALDRRLNRDEVERMESADRVADSYAAILEMQKRLREERDG